MKIQEAIIKKNSIKYKLKSVLNSFEIIWDKNKLKNTEKDLHDIIMKLFGILSQQNDIETQIALRNAEVEVEFEGKKMKLIALIKYMELLNKQMDVIKSLKDTLLNSRSSYYGDSEDEVEIMYEKRRLVEVLNKRIDALKDRWRKAQVVLEKTNWTEEL